MTVYDGRIVASDHLIFFPFLFSFLTGNVHHYFFLIFDFVINIKFLSFNQNFYYFIF